MALAPGQRFGRYELLNLLGAGGMGEVYRGLDPSLGREVAIKILATSFADTPCAFERFQREARAVSALNHPNICTLFDAGFQDGNQFIVMELLEGQTLREMIQAGPLPLASVLQLGTQIASAVEAAHLRGIIHRDIKPANIFVTRNGIAKLLDFGLAKFQESTGAIDNLDERTLSLSELTTYGIPLGTVTYMSPEQAQGHPAGTPSDLFSLGAVLYEMVTGQRAFPANSAAEVFALILGANPIPPSRLQPGIPREFDVVVFRLLDKSPQARYSSAGELVAALQVLSGSRPVLGEIHLSPPASQVRPSAKRLPSVVVLPLMDLSPVAGQDYFVDGLTEALITGVARLGGMRVISRTSSMCYKNTKKSVPQIGQEVGVDSILEGSVLRSGDRLRLTCRLIDSHTEELVWSESFDRNLQDILSLHDEVSHAVAASVRASIEERSGASLLNPRKLHPECYDSYLRGRYFWNKRDEPNLKRALACFQQALDIDPLYAPAYAGIADSYFYLGYSFGRMDPKDAMPRARAAALRALELDPQLAEGYGSLANVQACFDWDWSSAESNLQRAIELNPSLGTAHHFYAILLSAFRRTNESLAHLHAALQGDPLSLPLNNMLGMMYFAARQYDEAIAALRKTLEMNPQFGLCHSVLGAALEAQGLEAEAAEEYLTSLEVGGHSREECDSIRRAYRERGIRGLHEEDLRQFEQRWDGWSSQMVDLAALNAGLGRRPEALDWLERACEARAGRLIWINSGTSFSRIAEYFDGLRGEPRFLLLMDRLGLPV